MARRHSGTRTRLHPGPNPMSTVRPRNHRSARTAGTRFERQVADTLADYVDENIDRRVKYGNRDRGDITGLRHMGGRLVVEVKNTSRLTISSWLDQVDLERGHDDALAGLVVAKRHGHGDPLDAVVLLSLRDLVALLTGYRPEPPREEPPL